jgi:lysophospholipase L1-like esterase
LEDRTFLAATKIMPLGDSITAAEVGHSSYRYYLWNTLQSNNYTNIDFVGSQTGVNGGSPLNPNFDQNHEGHWGWRADQILGSIVGWASTYRPDVVLMHLGTNDMFQSQSVSSTINELGSIIDTIRQSSPNVTIVMAQVIPSTQSASQLQQLNSQIPSLVSQKNTAQSKVILVDQWSGFNASSDTYDGIHPNAGGEQKMANKWYSALTTVLTPGNPNPPPSGTYLADSLTPTFTSNGWGPYEKNKSNGEANANDGGTITLNGTTYTKGLGVHAGSELRYTLNSQYSSFQSDIGIDDEVGNGGSVVFQVWDNLGNKLYDSGAMTGATATKSINVNVAGKSEIRLIVTDAGNGNDSDHGDWAFARLQAATQTGPVVNAFSGATINEGGTYTANGSFTDTGSTGPWTGTVNYGDGSGSQSLTLNADKTFNLSHVYADNGGYTVTVTVTRTGSSASGTAGVTVNNVAPTVTMPANATVNFGTPFSGSGSFTDPGTLDTFTGTVNYGDGSGNQTLTLNANKTFNLSKNYASGGLFTVTVTITDKDGGAKTGTMTVQVNGGPVQQTTYVSDLAPTFTSNAWGPYEKDKSNGEANANDGGPIRIGGVTYAKGLGVHAPSELRYALNKQYDRFLASVGVDGEVGNSGSVRFQVFGDNVLLYDSQTVRGGQAPKSVDVSVANVTELKLIVTDNGDNNYDDHADWGDARLTKAQPAALTVNAFSGATIDEGSAYSATGSFFDPGAGPWTATVNYGDGSGVQALALNADKTFSLSHAYADNGSYTVTVVVNDGTTTAQNTATVGVNNVVPAFSLGADVGSSPTFSYNGSFTDPGADSWTATVDYGDGSAPQTLPINQANKTFALSKVYAYNGAYSVKVTIVDDDGGTSSSTNKVTVTGGQNRPETYLSDLNPTFQQNGWGSYERDKSNGENATGDGRTITVAGATFTKGLGVHAASDLRFDLTGGAYTSFDTSYGVDDEEGGAGSVRFQIYLDGVLTWDSGVVRGGQGAGHITLSVVGKSQLRLVVTDAGDNNYSDHADWASAKLISG